MDHFECSMHARVRTDKETMLASSPMLQSRSFSSAFFPLDTSITLADSTRRPSFSSSDSSIGLDVFSSPSGGMTSPSTPTMTAPSSAVPSGAYLKNAVHDLNFQSIHSFSNEDFSDEDALWMGASLKAATQQSDYHSFANMEPTDMDHAMMGPYTQPYYQVVSQNPINLSLSLPIFSDASPQTSLAMNNEDFFPWPSTVAQTPPRTITPTATYHPNLASSPAVRDEPMTPMETAARSSVGLSSSPMASFLPCFLPSQHELDESPFSAASSNIEMTPGDMKRMRRATSRLARQKHARKGPRASSRTPRSAVNKSGFNCEEIIPQNEFACKYKDCIDKDTGKQKRIKRQEHKRRHEKTVHEKERHNQHQCWVANCKTAPFSRTDNLKSHLQKTHGKKSANARNRYVATQDKNSEFYDPEWVGDLTEEGYPVLG